MVGEVSVTIDDIVLPAGDIEALEKHTTAMVRKAFGRMYRAKEYYIFLADLSPKNPSVGELVNELQKGTLSDNAGLRIRFADAEPISANYSLIFACMIKNTETALQLSENYSLAAKEDKKITAPTNPADTYDVAKLALAVELAGFIKKSGLDYTLLVYG